VKAVIQAAAPNKLPCVVKITKRKGLTAHATTWCNREANAADGVIQVPDGFKCCPDCETQIARVDK